MSTEKKLNRRVYGKAVELSYARGEHCGIIQGIGYTYIRIEPLA